MRHEGLETLQLIKEEIKENLEEKETNFLFLLDGNIAPISNNTLEIGAIDPIYVDRVFVDKKHAYELFKKKKEKEKKEKEKKYVRVIAVLELLEAQEQKRNPVCSFVTQKNVNIFLNEAEKYDMRDHIIWKPIFKKDSGVNTTQLKQNLYQNVDKNELKRKHPDKDLRKYQDIYEVWEKETTVPTVKC